MKNIVILLQELLRRQAFYFYRMYKCRVNFDFYEMSSSG